MGDVERGLPRITRQASCRLPGGRSGRRGNAEQAADLPRAGDRVVRRWRADFPLAPVMDPCGQHADALRAADVRHWPVAHEQCVRRICSDQVEGVPEYLRGRLWSPRSLRTPRWRPPGPTVASAAPWTAAPRMSRCSPPRCRILRGAIAPAARVSADRAGQTAPTACGGNRWQPRRRQSNRATTAAGCRRSHASAARPDPTPPCARRTAPRRPAAR